jgi:hypothetical protein
VSTEITRIKISLIPMVIGKQAVAELVVSELGFKAFGDAVDAAGSRQEGFDEGLLLERIERQTRAYDADGAEIKLGALEILQMPIPYAKQVHAALQETKSPAGEVIRAGDGVSAPILYKLGTPLVTGGDSITELEIQAKTLGDISTVYAADNRIAKTLALIEKCATPLGAAANLMRLPAWALALITTTDGTVIMKEVLPRFLA